jgi:TPR repeat protein
VAELEERDDHNEEITGKEWVLGGRACHEIIPKKRSHRGHWQDLGEEFFRQAILHGENSAHYYRQFYKRFSADKNPTEIWEALPTDDPEVIACIAYLVGTDSRFHQKWNREQHLHGLKEAILAHNNMAQFYLGKLYGKCGKRKEDYLVPNIEKARFWFMRALDRGCEDAKLSLNSLP